MRLKEKLQKIKALVFDVDGVLSTSTVVLLPDGEKARVINTKDGYALHLAAQKGFILAIISGGTSPAIQGQYTRLGFSDIYTGVAKKIDKLEEFLDKHQLSPEEILYMGDDIPDYEVMQRVGLPVSPADAAQEIKDISVYVSSKTGGNGCVRDVVEKVLKVQGHWLDGDKVYSW